MTSNTEQALCATQDTKFERGAKMSGLKKSTKRVCISILLVLSILFSNSFVWAATTAADKKVYYKIKSVWQGSYLYESKGQVKYGKLDTKNLSFQWEVEKVNGYKRIKNRATGHYMNIHNIKNDFIACSSIEETNTASQWILEDYNNRMRIQNVAKNTLFAHIEGMPESVKCTTVNNAWQSALWDFENVETGKLLTSVRPDLLITDVKWTPEQPEAGSEVTFSATIKNVGEEALSPVNKFRISFMIDGTEVSWSENISKSLEPGAEEKLTADKGLTKNGAWVYTAGVHRLRVFVDNNNNVIESGETNNVLDMVIPDSTSTEPAPEKRGATLPFTELEAEDGRTNGTVSKYSTTYRSEASEASGRKFVKLDAKGKYVEWTAPSDANTLIVRYSIPDAPKGKGIDASLSLYINNVHKQDLTLTSKYAWVYGNYPWSNDPAKGNPHKFFDEANVWVSGIKAGDVIKLQKDAGDTAAYYLIDLIDIEQVEAAKTMPKNYLSVTNYGATANDNTNDTAAFVKCISAAKTQNKGVWIPKGKFVIDMIDVNNVTIRGAGMWYSILTGSGSRFRCSGDNCKFYDFAMFGETDYRDDNSPNDNAFSGWPGNGSEMNGLWIEHKKCAFWVGEERFTIPANNLRVVNCRFRNLMADAINFCNGTSNSIVENCHARYAGDDALATWSFNRNVACNNNTFRNNTIQIPWLASGIAIYGGSNHIVENNVISDTITGGSGIYINTNFDPVPMSGTMIARNNTLIRCGANECYTGYPPGAIRILAYQKEIKNVNIIVDNNDIIDPVQSGISFQGPMNMSGVTVKNTRISGGAAYGIHVDANAKGSAEFENVKVENAPKGGIKNDAGTAFKVIKGEGNVGW